MRPICILVLAVASSAQADPVVLDAATKAASLCSSLQPAERVRFKDGPIAAADQKSAFEEKRKAAADQMYQLTLQPKEFVVTEADSKEATVSIDTTRPFRGLGGALTIYDIEVDELKLHYDASASKALGSAITEGRASLVITFKIADEESPCFSTTAKTYILATDFVSAEVRDGATVLARATEEDGFAPQMLAKGKPTAEVVPLGGDDGKSPSSDLVARVAKIRPDAQRCYETALAQDPTLDGSVVFAWTQKGAKWVPSVQAESVENDDVVACLTKAVSSLTAPATKKVTISVRLSRE